MANSALLFDGINGYAEVADNSAFSVPTTGEITISVWMRPDVLEFSNATASGDGPYVHWMQKGDYDTPAHEWTFRMYSVSSSTRPNRISFYVYNSAGGLGVGSYFQDTVIAGQWIHVVGKIDSTKTYIYKNGVLRDSDVYTASITPTDTTAPIGIGAPAIQSSDPGYFQGAIDEIRIYNYALSDAEVLAIYNNNPPSSGLVGYWSMDESTGTTATDSVSGIIASFNGGVSWTAGREAVQYGDTKPKLDRVINPKPNNVVVASPKPNMTSVIPLNEQYYPVTVTAGMPMGLLLGITYKDGFTIQSSYSP